MKCFFVIIVSFLLTGCILPHKSPHSAASAFVLNDKICVYVSANDLVLPEKILSITINEYGQQQDLFTKSYVGFNKGTDLVADQCIQDLSSFPYEIGKGYIVLIKTPLHSYKARFIVWKLLGKVAITWI